MLKDILKASQSAIFETWLAQTLGSYQSSAAKFFQYTKDPFANPVGSALVRGMTEVFRCLLATEPIESVRGNLDEIVKIRAVQDFSPSQAISFIFLLKNAVRKELGAAIDKQGLSADLAEFESKIDQVALLAFDVYVQCREQVYELRVD